MDSYNIQAVIKRFELAMLFHVPELEDAGLTIGDVCIALKAMRRESSTGVVPPSVVNPSKTNQS